MLGRSLIDALVRSEARNSPTAYLRRPDRARGKRVVVCVGDSITRGEVSCDYIALLEEALGDRFFFVNAGINNDRAVDVAQRIEPVVMCRPEFVTVLIGTNDANRVVASMVREPALRRHRVADTPDILSFEAELTTIAARLAAETGARVAFLSIPPIGEELAHVAMAIADIFSCIIEEVAHSSAAAYLPVFERMVSHLKANGAAPRDRYEALDRAFFRGVVEERLFGLSYDAIADRRRFLLHSDILHLNCVAAGMIAELIRDFLEP